MLPALVTKWYILAIFDHEGYSVPIRRATLVSTNHQLDEERNGTLNIHGPKPSHLLDEDKLFAM